MEKEKSICDSCFANNPKSRLKPCVALIATAKKRAEADGYCAFYKPKKSACEAPEAAEEEQ